MITLGGAAKQKLGKGAWKLTAQCNESCNWAAAGKLTGPKRVKKLKLAPAAGTASATPSVITVKVSRKGVKVIKKALASRKKVTLIVTVTARDDALNTTSVQRKIVLKK